MFMQNLKHDKENNMYTDIRINTIANNTTSEVREAEKALVIAKIKALQLNERNQAPIRIEAEINTKLAMLKQMDLIPNLFEMIENNCTVKELEQVIKKLGYQRLDINLIKPKPKE